MGKKILIVDDEPDFVGLLKVRLERNGYEVMEAGDGEEGLKKCEEGKPDLVLLDIMMPKKDGYTMLRDLKANNVLKAIPVIAVTAKPGVKELLEVEGVSDFIVKPFEDEDLLVRIKRALETNA